MSAQVDEPLTLQDRVQGLRLPDKVDLPGRSGGGWLPWALCLLLALTTVSLAARLSTVPAVGGREPPPASAKEAAGGYTPTARPAAAAAGAVVLESKGYIIAAHQIQVSPIQV